MRGRYGMRISSPPAGHLPVPAHSCAATREIRGAPGRLPLLRTLAGFLGQGHIHVAFDVQRLLEEAKLMLDVDVLLEGFDVHDRVGVSIVVLASEYPASELLRRHFGELRDDQRSTRK
jgi:hypothetical protein